MSVQNNGLKMNLWFKCARSEAIYRSDMHVVNKSLNIPASTLRPCQGVPACIVTISVY